MNLPSVSVRAVTDSPKLVYESASALEHKLLTSTNSGRSLNNSDMSVTWATVGNDADK